MGGFCILVRIAKTGDESGEASDYEILLQRRGERLKYGCQWCLPGGAADRAEGVLIKDLSNAQHQDEATEALRRAVARRVALREVIEEAGGGEGCPVRRNVTMPAIPEGQLDAVGFSCEEIVIPPRLLREFLHDTSLSREIRDVGRSGKPSSTSYFVHVLQGKTKSIVFDKLM